MSVVAVVMVIVGGWLVFLTILLSPRGQKRGSDHDYHPGIVKNQGLW